MSVAMQKLKAEIDAALLRHLEEHPFWRALADESPAGFDAVRAVLTAPGKRLRPLLMCAACRAAGREPLPDLLPAALALELAHSFILIHDDIMDRSAVRRGGPTLPARMDRLFETVPSDGFRGSDFAMVTGDLLYTLAIESLLRTEATDAQRTEAIRLFTLAALDTGRGALLEMRAAQRPLADLTTEDISRIYALKTGRYTFALPLELAACFAGCAPPGGTFWRSAGIAFQLKNDLDDLRDWLDGGPLPDDLRDGRRTWALVRAWHGADAAGRARLAEPPGEALKAVFEQAGVCSALRAEMDRHARAAAAGLAGAGLRALLATAFSAAP